MSRLSNASVTEYPDNRTFCAVNELSSISSIIKCFVQLQRQSQFWYKLFNNRTSASITQHMSRQLNKSFYNRTNDLFGYWVCLENRRSVTYRGTTVHTYHAASQQHASSNFAIACKNVNYRWNDAPPMQRCQTKVSAATPLPNVMRINWHYVDVECSFVLWLMQKTRV